MKRFGVALLFAAFFAMMLGGGVAQAAYPDPDVDIDVDGDPSPGDTVPVVGHNWCPDSDVSIYLDGVFQGTAHTDADGTFTFPLELSEAIESGDHTVTVVGYDFTCTEVRSATAIITIAGGAAEGGTSALPFTGSNISVGALLLVALLLVGAVALFAGRRREAAHEES